MRKTVLLLAAGAAALALAPGAPAADIGANDDSGKFAPDGGASIFARMHELGLRQTVLTVRFRPSEPEVIQDGAFLDRAVPEAVRAGLRVVLAVYPYPPRELELGLSSPEAFGAYAALLARTYPDVRQFVIGNEPNQPAFVRPQFAPGGAVLAAAFAGAHLAAAYDALKAVDPGIRVVGVGLSPRGNDRPFAVSNASTSPVRFLHALGSWYRSSGRTTPLMDGFSFHPYPARATDPLDRGYPWPNAGFADLDRVRQALWDAFAGTGQPTTVGGLRLYLDEVGWQVDTVGLDGYTGVENVPVATEAHQARVYGELVRRAACDEDVAEVNLFGFVDDAMRDAGFQAALHRLDWTPRPAAEAVRQAIADTEAGCDGLARSWSPARDVVGAWAGGPAVAPGGRLSVRVVAAEGASATACMLSARPRASRGSLVRALQARAAGGVRCVTATVQPGRVLTLVVPPGSGRGRTTIGVRLTSEGSELRSASLLVDPSPAIR